MTSQNFIAPDDALGVKAYDGRVKEGGIIVFAWVSQAWSGGGSAESGDSKWFYFDLFEFVLHLLLEVFELSFLFFDSVVATLDFPV